MIETVMTSVNDLMPHPANPRRGNISAIRESIRNHGWHGVVVVQAQKHEGEDKFRILVGRHRWEAAVAEGYSEVPVQFRLVDDFEALRLLLADNRASDLATYDDDTMLTNLREISENGGLNGTLFGSEDLELLKGRISPDIVSDAPAFQGDYADAGAEMEQRKQAADRIAEAMKDVVLVMKPADYAQFQEDVKALQKRWKVNGAIIVTIMAVRKCAEQATDLEEYEKRFAKMSEMVNDILWAVPPGRRLEFQEMFALIPNQDEAVAQHPAAPEVVSEPS